ncbi:MAG: hypothetical protein WCR42_08755 [bacterium]
MKKSKIKNFDSQEGSPSLNGDDINRNEQFQLYRNGKIYLPRKSKTMIKKKYKIIILVLVIIIFLYFFVKFVTNFTHISYSSIEYYKFEVSKLELLSEIVKFKELHPELNPLIDDPIFGNSEYDKNVYMAPMFFYYSDKQRVLYTVVVETPRKNQSAIGFYLIINPKDKSRENDEEINFSLSSAENKKQLKLFEERIVNPLHKQIQEKYRHSKKH